jgi:putative ABC transport system permease protein
VTNEGKALSILNDISFNLPSCGMFFIFGKSGCGKSTLLNIFEGLMKPTKGEILYNGKNVSKFNKKELNNYLKNEIGIIFQSFNLINDMTALENLTLATKIKGIDDKKLINDYLEKYKINHIKDKKVSLLSGGEKQRICLIRSLLNDPKVIFADEPTGNLDEENSYLLMNELKELSKTRLIIVVSHNKKLVDEFNDGFLDLTNGRQLFVKEIKTQKKEEIKESKIKKKNGSFISFMLNHNLRRDLAKNIISIFSLIFTVCICFVSIGFNNGVEKNSYNLIKQFQNNNSYKVSKIIYEEINDSNLKLQKTEKPTLEEINDIFGNYENVEIHNNIDYFFGDVKETRINKELQENITYVPVNNIDANNIVYVNDVFNDMFKDNHNGESILNKTINLHLKRNYLYKNTTGKGKNLVSEDFILYIPFYVGKIKEEFSYLNYPKVYFSIDYFETILSDHFCNNIFKETGIRFTYLSLLGEATNTSELANYSYQVYLDTIDDVYDFNEKTEEYSKYKIVNDPFITVDSFKELSTALYNGFIFFIFIVIASSIALISFLSYSTYVFNKKQSAILTIMGAENDQICMVYIIEQIVVGFLSLLFSFLLLPFTQKFLNSIIEIKTKFENLILLPSDFKTKLLISMLFIGLIFVFVCLPLVLSKNNEIYKELKEE